MYRQPVLPPDFQGTILIDILSTGNAGVVQADQIDLNTVYLGGNAALVTSAQECSTIPNINDGLLGPLTPSLYTFSFAGNYNWTQLNVDPVAMITGKLKSELGTWEEVQQLFLAGPIFPNNIRVEAIARTIIHGWTLPWR